MITYRMFISDVKKRGSCWATIIAEDLLNLLTDTGCVVLVSDGLTLLGVQNTDSIEAAKAELAMVNARLLRLEEGLFEAQEIMLAMQVRIHCSGTSTSHPTCCTASLQFIRCELCGNRQ